MRKGTWTEEIAGAIRPLHTACRRALRPESGLGLEVALYPGRLSGSD